MNVTDCTTLYAGVPLQFRFGEMSVAEYIAAEHRIIRDEHGAEIALYQSENRNVFSSGKRR